MLLIFFPTKHKADELYEKQEGASSKKSFVALGNQIHSTLELATNLLDSGFKLIPDGEERYAVRIETKSIEMVNAKEHEMTSSAANVALHGDRFSEYARRKSWNNWALETYRKVTEGIVDIYFTTDCSHRQKQLITASFEYYIRFPGKYRGMERNGDLYALNYRLVGGSGRGRGSR